MFVALDGPSAAADEAAEDVGRIEDPQQVHGRVPVKPGLERPFARLLPAEAKTVGLETPARPAICSRVVANDLTITASHPATFADVLSQEQSAEAAIYRGDPEPFKALWSHTDDVSLFGAFGPCKKGWHQVGETTDWVASRYRDGAVTAVYEVDRQVPMQSGCGSRSGTGTPW